MSPLKRFKRFIRIEDGFVSVEWIALTASLAVAAVAIGFMVLQSGTPARNSVQRELVQATSDTGGAIGNAGDR